MSEITILIWILVLNFIVSVLYFVWHRFGPKSRRDASVYVGLIVMLLCPVIGPCFYLLAKLWKEVFMSEPVNLEDVVFSKARVKASVRAQEEQERNIVPIEEAIEITNRKDLRSLMMNVVRGDIREYLASVALALNSEDTETAHYAASVLQDALNDFRIQVEKDRKACLENNEFQKDRILALIEYMNPILKQRVFNPTEQITYVTQMDEVAEILYEKWPTVLSASQYEELSLRLLEIRDYVNTKKWCERAEYFYPSTLSTFTCKLKLYFNSGQREQFFKTVEELKKSNVVVDSETLELLRVFR